MSSFSIIAKLGLDSSAFSQGLNSAAAQTSRFGDTAAKELQRKLGSADVFKGLMQGLGIASAQQIAEKLVEPFKASAEAAEQIAHWTDVAAESTQRLLQLRQSDAQQLAAMEKEYRRMAEGMNQPVAMGFFEKAMLAVMGGPILASKLISERQAELDAAARAERGAKLSLKAEQIEAQRSRMKKSEQAAEEKAVRDEAARQQKLQTAGAKLAAFEREQRLAKMSDEERLVALSMEKAEVDRRVATIEQERRLGAQFSTEGIEDHLSFLEQQRDLNGQIEEITRRRAAAEKEVGKEVESNIEKFVGLRGEIQKIESIGRGDRALSDRELAKKISTTQADISMREIALRGQVGGVGGGPFDLLLEGQRINLQQALQEQQLRDEVRRNVRAFGEQRAFDMFGGSEQRFRDILAGSIDENTQILRGAAEDIRRIKEGFERGTARTLALPLNGGG